MFFDYVITKNAKKLSFLIQVPIIFEKYHFWTCVTIGSCSTLDWDNAEKIQFFFTV